MTEEEIRRDLEKFRELVASYGKELSWARADIFSLLATYAKLCDLQEALRSEKLYAHADALRSVLQTFREIDMRYGQAEARRKALAWGAGT